MSNRITAIEQKIGTLLKLINGTSQGTYTYKTKTGTVDIEDIVLSDATEPDGNVHYEVSFSPEIVVDKIAYGQNAYMSDFGVKIIAKIENLATSDHPKLDAMERLNDVFCDLQFLFYKYYSLDNIAESCRISRFYRVINPTNNRITSAYAEITLSVQFSQSGTNPDRLACGI